MMTSLQNWFGGLSLREKIMIGVAAALTSIVVIIFLITLPLLNAIVGKQKEYTAALERRTQIQARIANIADAKPVAFDSSGSLQQVISQSAVEAGFALDRADSPAADTVDIAMAKAKPQALMTWLNEWEARGIIIHQLDMKAANDGTVSLTASLKRPQG
jgi:general secretion pathway protein M